MLSGKLFGEHACKTSLFNYSTSVTSGQGDKVNAVKCDFYVFVLYRKHLNFLPVVVISNLCIAIYY